MQIDLPIEFGCCLKVLTEAACVVDNKDDIRCDVPELNNFSYSWMAQSVPAPKICVSPPPEPVGPVGPVGSTGPVELQETQKTIPPG